MATKATPAVPAPAPAPAITLTKGELAAVDAAFDAVHAVRADVAATDALTLRAADKAELDASELLPIGELTDALETLKAGWNRAHANWAHAERGRASAQHAKDVAAVWMARIAFRTATHADVANKRYPYNITGAAKVLGMPVATLRPYALAGQVLDKDERAGLLSEPDATDVALLNESFDAGARAQQREKRLKEKEAKLALEAAHAAAQAELEALKAATPPATDAPADAPATDATDAPATDAPVAAPVAATDVATDAPAPVAPVAAPVAATAPVAAPAPAGPSLQDDAVAAAKHLAGMVKRLQADKDKDTLAKVSAILADVFPALKR